jgi:multidrug resistance efflux pump
MSMAARILRVLVTLAAVIVAIFLIAEVWDVYMVAPWTRDGRVQAETAVVAPDVSARVISVPLVHNQFVYKGEELFRLDPRQFRIALDQAVARREAARVQLIERQDNQRREQAVRGLVSGEQAANSGLNTQIALASLKAAQADVEQAKLNLVRATVYAPVTGYITNLRLQVGDYARAGSPLVTVVNSQSFRVIAYFKETKLDKIPLGAPVSIKLMAYRRRLTGHVQSIGRGISNQNDTNNRFGLPEVNPIFDWVRLAQRIPVDITINSVPPGVILSSGMTASVDVGPPGHHRHGLGGRIRRWFEDNL